ncbi:Xaa-Pro aminopeptidase [Propionibacterium cyclohexanicum]|uniref:Xaa-Pro aminopeptidase n=1 Tax=Propionibacterium cyclohexanicum TaxID=64702 RepID=A0A1H9R2H5_9ACTN|nr:Xaa-Pro peptidase family protein [Propionibacterium cyclohexanicum]SER66924.1 Xaa-Pro aminopeptidase [Propionibacterium cyclohexanicum]
MTDPALTWTPTTDDLRARLESLRSAAGDHGFDAVIVSPGADLRYFIGRSQGSHERLTALVAPAEADPFLVVPALERPGWTGSSAERLGIEMPTWEDHEDPYRLVADRLGPVSAIGVDDFMPAMHALSFENHLHLHVSPAAEAIRALRMRKGRQELAALAAVGAAIDRVHARIAEWLRPGRTESEVGDDIARAIVEEGHERPDFVIVASGPNGASPHHEQSKRVINAGEPVVIDIGGPAPSGYFSDSTRTYCIGEPADRDFATVHALVRKAQQAGIDAACAGSSAESVDIAARAVITEAGYGPYFITRVGHGIGLEVHEHPFEVRGNTTILEPGMVFSVEPGIYLPGRFGVRIEDIVAVSAEGPRLLNHSPRDWTLV